jgi:hypothetical protein
MIDIIVPLELGACSKYKLFADAKDMPPNSVADRDAKNASQKLGI